MIELHVDIKPVTSRLKGMTKDAKWAISDALNDMAKEVQDYQVKRNFPRAFTLRSKWYVPSNKYGVKVRRSGTNTLESMVYSRAPWLAIQETGGIKRPNPGNKSIPIAVKARSNQARRIARPKYVQALVQSGQAFFRGKQLLTTTKTGRLRYEYAMVKQARIAPRLRFYQTSQALTKRRWPLIVRESLLRRLARSMSR